MNENKTIFRTIKNKNNPYAMIDRRSLEHPNLSAKAKGILAYLLSRPDNWEVYMGDLLNRFTDGEKAIRSGVYELLAAGYLVRNTVRDAQKRFVAFVITIHEQPVPISERTIPRKKDAKPFAENGEMAKEEPSAQKPFAEKRQVEKRQVENGALNNNKLSNKDLNNKEHGAQTAPMRRTAARIKGDPMDGILDFAAKAEKIGEVADRINAYPADVQDTLRILVELWGWPNVPAAPARHARGGNFALWINDLREINELITGHGAAALRAAHVRWAESKFTVSHPGALTRTIFAAVSELNTRAKKQPAQQDQPVSPFARLIRPDGTAAPYVRPTRESLGLTNPTGGS